MLKTSLMTYAAQPETPRDAGDFEIAQPAEARRHDMRLVDPSHTVEHGMVPTRGCLRRSICDFLTRRAFPRDLRAGDRVPHRPHRHGREHRHRTSIRRFIDTLTARTFRNCPSNRWRIWTRWSYGTDGRAIGPEAFRSFECAAALCSSGPLGPPLADGLLLQGHPFLTRTRRRWLADEGAALVGIDSYNIDDTEDWSPARAHRPARRRDSDLRAPVPSREPPGGAVDVLGGPGEGRGLRHVSGARLRGGGGVTFRITVAPGLELRQLEAADAEAVFAAADRNRAYLARVAPMGRPNTFGGGHPQIHRAERGAVRGADDRSDRRDLG